MPDCVESENNIEVMGHKVGRDKYEHCEHGEVMPDCVESGSIEEVMPYCVEKISTSECEETHEVTPDCCKLLNKGTITPSNNYKVVIGPS